MTSMTLSLSHDGDYAGAVVAVGFEPKMARLLEQNHSFMSNTEKIEPIEVQIRTVLHAHGRLNKNVDLLEDSDDLYESGMTSHASVNVMLGLEGAFDVEFPDHMLKRNVFSSIQSIRSALGDLMTAA